MSNMTATSDDVSDYGLRDYIIHGVYFNIYGLVKYLPSPLGDTLRYMATKPFIKRLGIVRIYEGVTFWYPYRISIGNNTSLNEWVFLQGYGGVVIGDRVRIGHRASIISSDHKIASRDVPFTESGLIAGRVIIEDDVYIGANSTILKGVRLGRGSDVAAGAVVTKDVEPFTIVAGVPARKIRDRE